MSKAYWENRAAQRELESQVIASKYLASMSQSLREAQQDIIRQIETFYSRYANENKVTLAEAKRYLTAKELKDFKNIDLKRFREMSLSGNPEYERILNAASYRVRISRLEAMNLMIEMRMAELYGGPNGLRRYTYTGLMEVYQNSYYKTMFDLSMQGAISGKVAALTDETMKEALTYNWSGKEFSERIWGHQKSTFQSIQKTLERGFAAGHSIDRTTKAIMEATNVSYSRAEALVRTESNFFHNLAARNSYADAGIEKYEILATLDHRTSDICREQDGKIYSEKDFKPGTNAPPFHVRCRTTTIPWFDESKYMDGEKRQSADGLIDSMTYVEWYERYVINPNSQSSQSLKQAKNIGSKHLITDQAIEKVPYIEIPGYSEKENRSIQLMHQDLLRLAKEQNNSDEVMMIKPKTGAVVTVLGDNDEVDPSKDHNATLLIKNSGDSILTVMHNHPGLSGFSLNDLRFFITNDSVKTLTIITNLGQVKFLTKANKYHKSKIFELLKKHFGGYTIDNDIDSKIEKFLKEANVYGIISKRR
ncbi:minor capsid protein [Schinkia azotoformans]|uniref:NAD+-asparagine ADP-ribosyltransferase n=1 Tax=Schinkia azotoformans LMG 9581 TaxID=1131731 RepID=K6DGU2_SCHAZ|nr:minor capsid protein [Schinkia azotoformans]EKN67484.1 NAD+-asparagine ADP-ribosyltransferase [Schinkia azotoformans LMG 9581]MEC1637357.1 minor capsid protein [Schinkia azotoformans]MEC1943761.1 minor capsid protein [Schinkia azotoformans]